MNQKLLRKGYTTGSCVTAAAMAAATGLLTGEIPTSILLKTPTGTDLTLYPVDSLLEKDYGYCGIKKDSGDDPDVTDGMVFYAKVWKIPEPTVEFHAGVGIGTVTKPGLDQPVGNVAINSTPRRMLTNGLLSLADTYGYEGGFAVEVSTPEGEKVAKRTFNSRLGIIGGLSILGTTGIVEPMSEAALIETTHAELRVRYLEDPSQILLLTPGNYGKDFIKKGLDYDGSAVKCSNFIGDALSYAVDLGFKRILLVGHGGKIVKLAGGIFLTHSKYGDCRFEIIATHSILSGVAPEVITEMKDCVSVDQMLSVITDEHLHQQTVSSIMDAIDKLLTIKAEEKAEIGCLMYTTNLGMIGQTDLGRTFGQELGFELPEKG